MKENRSMKSTPREVTVPVCEDETIVGRRGDVLETRGIGRGVGIGLYDSRSKTGAIAHLSQPEAQDIRDFVLGFYKATVADYKEMEVYLRGGAPAGSDGVGSEDYINDKREIVHKGLMRSGIDPNKVDTVWNESAETKVFIYMDAKNGQVRSGIDESLKEF